MAQNDDNVSSTAVVQEGRSVASTTMAQHDNSTASNTVVQDDNSNKSTTPTGPTFEIDNRTEEEWVQEFLDGIAAINAMSPSEQEALNLKIWGRPRLNGCFYNGEDVAYETSMGWSHPDLDYEESMGHPDERDIADGEGIDGSSSSRQQLPQAKSETPEPEPAKSEPAESSSSEEKAR